MFFHPDPAKVVLSEPEPERDTAAARWRMRASVILFAALTGYVGLELLRQGAVLGLLGYVACLAGGIAAVAGDVEMRPPAERRQPPQPAVRPDDGRVHLDDEHAKELRKRIGKLFEKYFEKYEPVEANRKLWEDATADARRFYQDEITEICRVNGYSADQVAWLIRHEVRQMNQRWRDRSPQFPRQHPVPRSWAVTARWAGLVTLVAGFAVAVFTAKPHLAGFTVVLLSVIWVWRCWLQVSVERADTEGHKRRQEEIDDAYRRWSARLQDRPKDAKMAEWLEGDRTVLLGMALDHFHLSRSRMVAHGFIEKPAPGAKRSQIKGGLPRYQKYQIWMFLLAEGGVHQLRASLDLLTGTLVEREQISYGYASIAAVRMLRKSGGVRTYELSLTAGEPIRVRVRETDPQPAIQGERDEDTYPTEENESATEDTAPDVASVTNTLRLLQGVVGGGMNWLREHNWANAWPDSQAE
jgi:hypothetical protein